MKPFNWPEARRSKAHASGEKYILERGNSRHSGFKLQLACAPSQIFHKTPRGTISDRGVENTMCDVCVKTG